MTFAPGGAAGKDHIKIDATDASGKGNVFCCCCDIDSIALES